jgi:hypothetical protein
MISSKILLTGELDLLQILVGKLNHAKNIVGI